MRVADQGEVGQGEERPLSPRAHDDGAAGPSALADAAGPSELPDASQSTLISEARSFLISLTNEQRAILNKSYNWSVDEHEAINQVLGEEFNSDGTSM